MGTRGCAFVPPTWHAAKGVFPYAWCFCARSDLHAAFFVLGQRAPVSFLGGATPTFLSWKNDADYRATRLNFRHGTVPVRVSCFVVAASLARGGRFFRVAVALSSHMLDNCSEATVSVCVENHVRQGVVQIFITVSTLLSMRDACGANSVNY